MPTRVSTILFSGIDPCTTALNIRQNYLTSIDFPEFSRIPIPERNEPAVYARDRVMTSDPAKLMIQVTFTGNANTQCQIAAAGGGILGIVSEATATFDNMGDAIVNFNLNHTQFTAKSPVNRQRITWEWHEKHGANQQTKFDETTHDIGTVIDLPGPPWTQDGSRSDPWITALRLAIEWADGATTIAEAATSITRETNGTGAGYTPGAEFMRNDAFELTRYLQIMGAGWFFNMNCTDCANVVTTLTNLLGGRYWEGRINAFTTTRILPITDITRANWVYHEFCWNQFDPGGSIWDATLRIPQGNGYVLQANVLYQNYIAALASGPQPNLEALSNRRRSVI